MKDGKKNHFYDHEQALQPELLGKGRGFQVVSDNI